MADDHELDIQTFGKNLRKQAFGFRQLAGGILDQESRENLLELAADRHRQAVTRERGGAPSNASADSTTPTLKDPAMGTYRVRFFKAVSSHGKTVNVCQRSIEIHSARGPDRAVEEAKQCFARLEHIAEWFLHADYVEVDPLSHIALDELGAQSNGRR